MVVELRNLPSEEKVRLARKCEPFFLAYNKTAALKGAFKNIEATLPKDIIVRYETEIWTIISATSQAIRYDSDCVQFTMNRNNYSEANKITKKKINHKRMVELVSILLDRNLINFYKGFYNKNWDGKSVESSMRSIMEFKNEWLNLFDVNLCKLYGTARQFDLVIVKDSKGNIVIDHGLRGIGKEKQLLKEWNKQIASEIITIDNQVVKPLYVCIFNHLSLNSGGRLYAGSFSTERSVLRQTITIGGNPTCEVDFRNIHFRILYQQAGVDYQEDCYNIACPEGIDPSELRKVVKLAAVIMLNADGESSAKRALRKKMLSLDYLKTITVDAKIVNYIFKSLSDLHPLISHHFFKGEWGRLQNIDSKIAKQVIKAFNVTGRTVLTYHDSFVCESRYIDFLITTMKEGWEIVLGDSKGFGYDIEFCN